MGGEWKHLMACVVLVAAIGVLGLVGACRAHTMLPSFSPA